MKLAVFCLAAVWAVSGCGGSEPAFTAEEVSATLTQPIREVLHDGMTMDPLSCIEDGDPEHWECVTTILDKKDRRYSANIEITCDSDSGECIWKPFEYIPTS